MDGSVADLSKYRLERAKDDLKTARDNYNEGSYRASVNRSYYALLKSNFPAQKMYEKAGFVYRGEQRLYAENTGMTEFLYYEKVSKTAAMLA